MPKVNVNSNSVNIFTTSLIDGYNNYKKFHLNNYICPLTENNLQKPISPDETSTAPHLVFTLNNVNYRLIKVVRYLDITNEPQYVTITQEFTYMSYTLFAVLHGLPPKDRSEWGSGIGFLNNKKTFTVTYLSENNLKYRFTNCEPGIKIFLEGNWYGIDNEGKYINNDTSSNYSEYLYDDELDETDGMGGYKFDTYDTAAFESADNNWHNFNIKYGNVYRGWAKSDSDYEWSHWHYDGKQDGEVYYWYAPKGRSTDFDIYRYNELKSEYFRLKTNCWKKGGNYDNINEDAVFDGRQYWEYHWEGTRESFAGAIYMNSDLQMVVRLRFTGSKKDNSAEISDYNYYISGYNRLGSININSNVNFRYYF